MEDLHLAIVRRRVSELRINPRNARKHSARQIAQLMGSISGFGFTNPLLIDENDVVIAGHARQQAAIELGLETVPTIQLTHLSETQKRGLMLADNRIAEKAGWDLEILKQELIELSPPTLEFDLSAIGFETPEIDVLIGEPDTKAKLDPADKVDAIDRSMPSIAQLGDLWVLGEHRILVGNSLEAASYAVVMDGEQAAQVVTDPPYNVPITGHVVGLGKAQHAEFAMASGEMSRPEFTQFLSTALMQMAQMLKDGGVPMSFMDWRHLKELLAAGENASLKLINLCVWAKTNGGMGSLYRSRHELCAIFKHGTAPHTNNVELGKHGRYRTNVWEYAGANTFRRGRKADLDDHPTVKPIAMIMDAIKDCSHRGEIVLDPFGGAGTTLLAAERTGRRARLIELDPYYVDATIRRWEKLTGQVAHQANTGFRASELQISASLPGSTFIPPNPQSRWAILPLLCL